MNQLEQLEAHTSFKGEQRIYRHYAETLRRPLEIAVYVPVAMLLKERPCHTTYYLPGIQTNARLVASQSDYQRYANRYDTILVIPDLFHPYQGDDNARVGQYTYERDTLDDYLLEELPDLLSANLATTGGRGIMGGQSLLGGLGRGREDRQLAAARGDDAPVDEKVVPQVHVVLVGGQRVGADGGGGEHHLDLLARAVHEGREAEFAAIAHQDDAPGDAHEVLGLLARLQMGVPLADLRYRGGDRQRDGVGGDALLHEAGALLRADLDLFGGVVRGGVHVLGVCFTHAPIVPGAGAPGRPQPCSAANRTRFAAHSPVRAAESDQGNAR